MAVVAFTPYTDREACLRSNTYICDGHGMPPSARSNRYIADGHGGSTKTLGHHCPSDPILAAAYMEAKRWNYERQHTISAGRKKGSVTHVQLYVSPTEEDHVPPEERLEMTRELIERTVLKDFPSIYIAHDNTSQGHCHISLCPFSEDGSHKLSMNNKLLYDLRRQMDVICVEHGYSIIECPELWGDKEYREWFFDIKEKGVVTIHPPAEQDKTFLKMEKKRARNYSRSKRAQTKKKEAQEAYFLEVTKGYSSENDAYFYTSPWLYNPSDPKQPLRIKRITTDGTERSELELRAAAMGAWAYHCEQSLIRKAMPCGDKLQKQLHTIMGKAYAARKLMLDLDIRTQEELVFHIKECGQDIGTLKRSIKKTESELEELHSVMRSVGYWEAEQDDEACLDLGGNGMASASEIEEIKKRYTRLLARNENFRALLEDRSKEYRYLKEAEKALNPASCKEEWERYLSMLFSKNVMQKAKRISPDHLEAQIYELGMILGLSEEMLDQYLIEVTESPDVIRIQNYREYKSYFLSARKIKRDGYERYHASIGVVDDLRDLADKLKGFGLLGLLLVVLVDAIAEFYESTTKMELAIALWEAEREKQYAEIHRRRYLESTSYFPEVLDNMWKEKQKSGMEIQRLISEVLDNNEKPREKLSTIESCIKSDIPKIER